MNISRRFFVSIIGILLIVMAMSAMLYDRYSIAKENVFLEVSKKTDAEILDRDLDSEHFSNEGVSVSTDNVDEDVDEQSTYHGGRNYPQKKYIAYLKIDKINLNTGLVAKNSFYNNVDRNVLTQKSSEYPDVSGSNLILASHSGNSNISYFRNLYKLKIGDKAVLSYKNHNYSYKIVDIYEVLKKGTVPIRRNKNATCLTLITCTKNSKTKQTVYILELYSVDGEVYD